VQFGHMELLRDVKENMSKAQENSSALTMNFQSMEWNECSPQTFVAT
jgi:hypothetical protein